MANFCVECGSALSGSKKFCASCGTPAAGGAGVAATPTSPGATPSPPGTPEVPLGAGAPPVAPSRGPSVGPLSPAAASSPAAGSHSKYSTPVRLEYIGGTSEKFWEAWIEGTKTYVHYGRFGTKGTTTVNDFDTLEKAEAAIDRKYQEKIRKGYVHS